MPKHLIPIESLEQDSIHKVWKFKKAVLIKRDAVVDLENYDTWGPNKQGHFENYQFRFTWSN